MSAPIGPGDWVECVDASPMLHIPTGLTLGGIYHVKAVDFTGGLTKRSGLLLAGCRHPGNPAGVYNPRRFRPIYRPNAEMLADLLRRSREPLREPADAREHSSPRQVPQPIREDL